PWRARERGEHVPQHGVREEADGRRGDERARNGEQALDRKEIAEPGNRVEAGEIRRDAARGEQATALYEGERARGEGRRDDQRQAERENDGSELSGRQDPTVGGAREPPSARLENAA